MILDNEIWKDVKDFEGLYQVSNLGRVKGIKRKVSNGVRSKVIKEKVLKISPDSQGYLMANLWKENKGYHKLVHRLVAIEFIENPHNLPEVNHKLGKKWDNRVSELEWKTASDNQKHSYTVLGRKGPSYGKFGVNNPISKKIKCDTFDMCFNSVSEAAKILGVCQSAISFVLLNQRRHALGMVFSYLK